MLWIGRFVFLVLGIELYDCLEVFEIILESLVGEGEYFVFLVFFLCVL